MAVRQAHPLKSDLERETSMKIFCLDNVTSQFCSLSTITTHIVLTREARGKCPVYLVLTASLKLGP